MTKMKTGVNETASAAVISGTVPAIFFLTGFMGNNLIAGALINCIVSFVGVIFIIKLTEKFYDVIGNKNIIEISEECFGKKFSVVLAIFFLLLIFVQGAYGLFLSVEQCSVLSGKTVTLKIIRIVMVVSAVICAYNGIEALTRQSYILLFVIACLILFLVISVKEGFNKDNLYPVLGYDIKRSFTRPLYLILYSAVLPLLLISDSFNDEKDCRNCVKRTVIMIFCLSFILAFVYALTVPYPLGKEYADSLEAIFAAVGSGEFLHRFEIFLLCLYLVSSIVSTSFVLVVCSKILTRLSGLNDERPFVLLFGILIYYLSSVNVGTEMYIWIMAVMALSAFLLPCLISVKKNRQCNRG